MSAFSVTSMDQLADALEKAGFKEDDVTNLRNDSRLLADIRELLARSAKVTYIVLDKELNPPDGLRVLSNLSCNFAWDRTRFRAYASKAQQFGRPVKIEALCAEVAGFHRMTASAAEFFNTHQWLIDDIILKHWKVERILFVGTIFVDSSNKQFVLCLENLPREHYERPDRPKWSLVYKPLDDFCDKNTIVALID